MVFLIIFYILKFQGNRTKLFEKPTAKTFGDPKSPRF